MGSWGWVGWALQMANAAEGEAPLAGVEQAEIAVMQGDRALASQLAASGSRLPEAFSLRPYVGENDLVRIEIALLLGARVREEDIEVAVIGSELHLLRRLAEADSALPPRVWSPRRYSVADPAARVLLRTIRAEERRERRAL